MLRSVFPQDILAELGRLQREAAEAGAPDDPMAGSLDGPGHPERGYFGPALAATTAEPAAGGAAMLHSPALALAPGIRDNRGARFPALNLRTSPLAIEVEAFMPGLSIDDLGLSLEGDVLVLTGERESQLPESDDGATVHASERFSGRFRRVIGLPHDIDAQAIEARYALGVLTVTVPRLQPVLARPIAIQDPSRGYGENTQAMMGETLGQADFATTLAPSAGHSLADPRIKSAGGLQ
ncbi:MAG: Hsp20/alpha crystallin family protein [Burkholderiales bacterium]